jgi:hypothetical protein
LITAVLAAVALALCASPAFAAETHPFKEAFGSANQPSFANAESLAIDQSNGDVLVIDAAANTVSRWHADGTAADFSALGTNVIDGEGSEDQTPEGGLSFGGANEVQVAVDSSGTATDGDIYVTQASRRLVYVFASSGAYLGQLSAAGTENFKESCGVTVDSTGAVYVGDFSGQGKVHKFVPSANPPVNADNTANFSTPAPCTVAAGVGPSAGSLFVARLNGDVTKLDASTGALEYVVSEGSSTTLSVDPTDGHLYVAEEGKVIEYDASGSTGATQVSAFASVGLVRGVAAEAGEVYVSRSGVPGIEVFGPVALLPGSTTEDATAVTKTTATLHGTVSADGGPDATCEFQYASEESFQNEGFAGASTAPCDPAGPFSGSAAEAVSAEISGLSLETSYRFRLLATNANGSNPGEALGFQTSAAVNLKTDPATNLASAGATLNGTINPEGVEVEECLFEYGEAESFNETIACAESSVQIGTGSAPVTVHADVSGLNPNTEYQFRLKAKNSLGEIVGSAEPFTTFGPPQVTATSVSEVTQTTAKVTGVVDANGEATTYVVQYVSDEDFKATEWTGAISVPAGGAPIGSGTDGVEVNRQLTGLTPFTAYHLRIVAENDAGSVEGPQRIFATYAEPGVGLPDGRVYEQVTPLDKNGAAPSGGQSEVQAALDGSGIVYSSHGGLPGGEGAQQFPSYLASRGSDWSTHGLLPSATQGSSAAVIGWSEDLANAYVGQADVSDDPVTFLQRDNATRSLRPIATESKEDLADNAGVGAFNYVDVGTDGSIVAFESFGALSPGGASGPGVRNTYVWDRDSDQLRLAGVFNDGSIPTKGTFAGSNEATGGGQAQYTNKHYTQAQHTLSDDGSRFFFRDAETSQLYVRLNPSQPQSALDGDGECTEAAMACTVRISASQRGVPDPFGEKPAAFMAATPDGSHAFFTSSTKLTDNATTGVISTGKDLYRYDVDSGELTDLVPDPGDFLKGANVQGVLGVSDDGSYVYFAANGVFADGASAGNCQGITYDNSGEGTCNLYLWHGGVISFIAPMQLSSGFKEADSANWMSTGYNNVEKSSRVTPDGRTLLFRSRLPLGEYENEETPEFYRYTADDGELSCVTCNPTGVAPTSPPTLRSIQQASGSTLFAGTLTRNLSVDGKRVFFETLDKLVTADTNGDAGCPFIDPVLKGARLCRDVYEWEAKGSGSCTSDKQNGGCLYLLSTGTSSQPSYFADASASGDDAFIFTDQSLVRQDRDQIVDIYDTRVGGGIASQNAPPPPPLCSSAEACRSAAPTPPAGQSPGSASFSGPGNEKPCKKDRVKKRGRCVKKSKAHKRKKDHRKRHASGKRG